MPSNFGQDSDLAEMLRLIAPYFEHKLFLSATPHNGHTRCFTGLLEQLDPVRFTQTSELDGKIKARIGEIVIRRLKREINQFDEQNRVLQIVLVNRYQLRGEARIFPVTVEIRLPT